MSDHDMSPNAGFKSLDDLRREDFEALEAENKELWRTLKLADEGNGQELHKALAEVARLREALERYGGHDITCPFTTGCTCGFRQALAQEQADGGKEQNPA